MCAASIVVRRQRDFLLNNKIVKSHLNYKILNNKAIRGKLIYNEELISRVRFQNCTLKWFTILYTCKTIQYFKL